MRFGLVLVAVCLVGMPTFWQPALGQSALTNETVDAAITAHTKIRGQWMQCIYSAFFSEMERTTNKAAAAELSFRACKTEEDLFVDYLPTTIGIDRKTSYMAAQGLNADFKNGMLKAK